MSSHSQRSLREGKKATKGVTKLQKYSEHGCSQRIWEQPNKIQSAEKLAACVTSSGSASLHKIRLMYDVFLSEPLKAMD
jgi:hypothetical protein